VKADKVKAKRNDLERLETKRENKKEIKRWQTKTEKFPAQTDSILIPFAFAFFIYQFHFINYIFHFFILISIVTSFTFFKKLHFEISRIPTKNCLYNIRPYIWPSKQKLSPQSLGSTRLYRNPETRPTILVRLYTGTHWFQQQYNICVRPGFLKIISNTNQPNHYLGPLR
jgi:hypothetical protein